MKRLAIILVVLVMGLAVSIRHIDFQKIRIIPLAARTEKTVAAEKTPAAQASTKKEDSAEKPVDANSPAAPTDIKKEDTDKTVDANSPDAPPSNIGKGRDMDRGRGMNRGRGTGGGMDRARSMGMDRGRKGMDRGRGMGMDGGIRNSKDGEDPNDPLVAINLNKIEMKNILPKLASWTGKVIIPTDEAMKAKITIYSHKEVTRSKAISLIFDALRDQGIIAEVSNDKLYLKPIAEAKLGYVPILTADEPLARVKDKSQLVEKYFRLEHTSPSKLVSVIAPLTPSYGHVTAYESSNILAVIDTVENLLRIKQTIAQFDIPESDQVTEEIFEIKNGDALEIVQVFELIFQKTNGSRSRYTPRPRPSSPAAKGASAPATSVIVQAGEIPIVLLPIPKHNWIIAKASADDMEKIKFWVAKLDIADSSPQEQTIIQILHVDPREVERLVEDALDNMPGTELKTSVVVKAMQDSKQIVIFGSEENRKFVERLIMDIDLPIDDIYENKDFKLEHADPDEIKTNLESLYESESGSISSSSYNRGRSSSRYKRVDPKDVVKVMSFPSLKQISVLATPEKLAIIEAKIKEWDIAMEVKENQYLLITLNNSDPVQMVELLSTLFSEDDNSGSDWIRRMFGGDDADNKKKIVGSLYGMLTFEAVPGTKKILVISKIPQAYPVIKALVEDLDSQEKGEAPKVITLNYADPEELSDQLNAILNERGTVSELKRKQQGLTLTGYKSTDDASSNSGSNNNDQQVDPGSIRPWWDSGRDDDTEMPLSNLIGKIRFVPVHRSKAILVIAPPEYYDDIEVMVKKLDQPEMQVMIEAVIVEVDHSSMTSLGVQFSSNPNLFNPIGLGLNSFGGLGADFDFSKAVSKGLTLSAGTNIDVLVDMLAKTVNAKVLNQPNLWTKDNEEAVFFKGREISIETSDQTYNTGATSKTEYKQIPIGVTLRVRPNITPAKDVDITVNLEISDLASDEVNSQPVINKLNTSTNLIIADGETIMLGGILFQNESKIKSKVPLLGDIPIVGAVFSHEDTSLRNSELLIFLTPHVVTNQKTNASKKFIIGPGNEGQSLMETKYISNPTERLQDIRESLNDALLKGMMNNNQ